MYYLRYSHGSVKTIFDMPKSLAVHPHVENDTPTLLYYILVTFNDLEDGIQQKFLMKSIRELTYNKESMEDDN